MIDIEERRKRISDDKDNEEKEIMYTYYLEKQELKNPLRIVLMRSFYKVDFMMENNKIAIKTNCPPSAFDKVELRAEMEMMSKLDNVDYISYLEERRPDGLALKSTFQSNKGKGFTTFIDGKEHTEEELAQLYEY